MCAQVALSSSAQDVERQADAGTSAEATALASSPKGNAAPIANLVDAAAKNIVTVEMLGNCSSVTAPHVVSNPTREAADVLTDTGHTSAGSSDCLPVANTDSIDVRIELSESLREDGRLLRMFVSRDEHLKAEARELAVKSWLIPGWFYDRWHDAFIAKYAKKHADAADLQERCSEVASALASKADVGVLEAKLATSGKDVFQLRDLLLTAAKDLSAPRRRLGTHTDRVMPPEAIEALKLQRQVRLRNIVLACLRGIYASGVGGEILRVATESAKNMIERFEVAQDEVCTARHGDQWHELKVLMDEIDSSSRRRALSDGASADPAAPLTDAADNAEKQKIERSKKEGKGTKFLLEKALTELGGEATTRELIKWIEEHPDFTEENSSIRLNQNLSRSKYEHQTPIWHRTLMSVLSCHFPGARRNAKGFVWRSPNAPMLTSGDDDNQPLPALPPEGAVSVTASLQAVPVRAVAKPRRRRKTGLLDAQAGEAAAGEADLSQTASAAGRGKRKALRRSKPGPAQASEASLPSDSQQAQTAPSVGPNPLAMFDLFPEPETSAQNTQEPKQKRSQPRCQDSTAAEKLKESSSGPADKRRRKANPDEIAAMEKLSFDWDAAIAAGSCS